MHEIRTHVLQQDSEHGQWRLILGQPAEDLSPYVSGYQGYEESAANFRSRLETPTGETVLIINFGPSYDLVGPWSREGEPVRLRSFAGGIHDGPAIVHARGLQHCLQVDFTPLGAYRFFRLPMHELANQVVSLDDIWGAAGDQMIENLARLPDWPARFMLIDELIRQRLALDANVCPATVWAWRQIERSGGKLRVKSLAEQIGWSQRHLIARFRDQIGLPPKRLARIVRFRQVARALDACRDRPVWGELAHELGYFDQAHFNREFRALSGLTPGEYWRRLLPNQGGVVAD